MALHAVIVLALQTTPVAAAQPPAAAPPAPAATPAPPREQVTVIERTGNDPREVPLNSRIAQSPDDNVASDPVAGMYLREWADCIVRIYRPASLSLLATPLNSPEQTQIIDRLTGHRFTRRTICARFRSMRIDNLVLRGALAEALWRWETRRERSAGPLAAPPSAAAASGRPALLAQAGRCLVEATPDGVARLMATRPGTRGSQRALAAMSEQIDECRPAGLPAWEVHPLALRGAVGEAYYLKVRNASGSPPAPRS
jgi:hypothetical protein